MVTAGEIVGNRVRAAREAAALSRLQLASAAGIHPSHVARIEQGIGNPSVETLLRLAEPLQVTAAALIEGLGAEHLLR